MITYMQFVDNETELSVGELNNSDKVLITMQREGDPMGCLYIELGEEEIKRLYKWLKESIDLLAEEKTP
jgi:hypothetical protein